MPAPVTPIAHAKRFIQAHRGRSAFAPFTGQDHAAFTAFACALDLYARSDDAGRRCALSALRSLASAAQPKCRDVFKAAIPAILDWSDEEPVWKAIGLPLEDDPLPGATLEGYREYLRKGGTLR